MKIAIDFDGTCVSHEFPKVGNEIGAPYVLKKLIENGHDLILWTMRSNTENNTGFSDCIPEVHNGNFLDDAVNWFKQHEIPLFGIQRNPEQDSWTSSPKAYAQLYIDDAALGAPLKNDKSVSERPYICWERVYHELVYMGLIKSHESQPS